MTRSLTAAAALCLTLASVSVIAQTAATPAARVIVQFKADSGVLRKQALSTGDRAGEQHAARAQALALRTGLALTSGAAVGARSQVVFARGISSAALAERLARESDVEFAVPDQRKRFVAAPNDPLYGASMTNSPTSGQWYLRAPDAIVARSANAVVSSINAEAAWALSTGSSSIVVAVLDTGIRFEHPDLKTIVNGGNLLAGYDMVADLDTANDGGGRDADASDPGDWIDQADIDANKFPGACNSSADIADSSWHGTQTAGLIGALTNNDVGMASVGRNVRILPVRVLGKCGGFDSDIIAGMRWAAGIDIGGGVPVNTNPAKVINMSLGGGGACQPSYADAVAEITARGTVIVASAGNSAGHAVSEPASCSGVIGVAGLRHIGTKVGFSDIGPEISISAPGGNCVNEVGACLFPIATTSNSGTTTPVSSIYTDSNNISVGTSFSAPLVAGTAALMLSARSTMTPVDVRAVLRGTARPFPLAGADPGTPACRAPNGVDQLECYCGTSTCGAGMLDAGAAVAAAIGLQADIAVSPTFPIQGTTVAFSAAQSTASTGATISSYVWSIADDGGTGASLFGAAGSTASATTTAAGRFTVRLTVADSANATTTTYLAVDVASEPAPAPPSGSGGGGALDASWLLALLVAILVLRRGRGTKAPG
jgi:serine protease